MMDVRLLPLIIAFAALASTAGARQDAPADAPATELGEGPKWTFQLEPSAWYVAPEGDVQFRGEGPGDQDATLDDLNMDSPLLSPLIDGQLRFERWRIGFGGFWFSSENDVTLARAVRVGEVVLPEGDEARTELDFWSVEATGGYRFLDRALSRNEDGRIAAAVALEGFAGMRMYDFDMSVERLTPMAGAPSDSDQEFFAEPLIGARLDLDFAETFSIDVTSSVGGFTTGDNTSYSFDIVVGGSWRPLSNMGVQIGYRQLLVNLEADDEPESFKFDGGFAGLYFGAQLRF